MKRYAIVRVDGRCPSWCGDSSKVNCIVCDFKDKKCKNCRYGDTKEQLIRKVATAMKIKSATIGVFMSNNVIDDLAKEIVEFLGVEE